MRRSRWVPLAVLTLAACGSRAVTSGSGQPSSQQFTRELRAVPRALIQAAVRTFDRHSIPVVEADEPGGRVRTVAVNLRAMARQFDEAPLSCPQGTPRDTRSMFRFDVKVRRTDEGSAVSLQTEPDGKTGCVVRAAFVSALLDEIARTAGGE